MNRMICLLVALLLVGCQGGNTRTYNSPEPLQPTNGIQYAASVTEIINSHIGNANMFKGLSCSLIIQQDSKKMPSSIAMVGGSPKLCEATIAAMQKSIADGSYPYSPDSISGRVAFDFNK